MDSNDAYDSQTNKCDTEFQSFALHLEKNFSQEISPTKLNPDLCD